MATVYARQTVLHDVKGRLDYIGSAQRQENLLGYVDGAAERLQGQYWKTVADESQLAFAQHGGHSKRAVEGRELVIKLPNSLLDEHTPDEVCRVLAESFEQRYHRPAAVALHYNQTKSNLHAHLIYSERELLLKPTVKVAPRNLFYDEQGRRRYKKGEILGENGKLRPGCRIVPKGEVYERRCFGAADPRYCTRTWLASAKREWLLPMLNGSLRGDVGYQIFDSSTGKLPQQHIGKNLRPAQKDAVARYNQLVRRYNQEVEIGSIPLPAARMIQAAVKRASEKAQTLQVLMEKVHESLTIKRTVEDAMQPGAGVAGRTDAELRMQRRLLSEYERMMQAVYRMADIAPHYARRQLAIIQALYGTIDRSALERQLNTGWGQEKDLNISLDRAKWRTEWNELEKEIERSMGNVRRNKNRDDLER